MAGVFVRVSPVLLAVVVALLLLLLAVTPVSTSAASARTQLRLVSASDSDVDIDTDVDVDMQSDSELATDAGVDTEADMEEAAEGSAGTDVAVESELDLDVDAPKPTKKVAISTGSKPSAAAAAKGGKAAVATPRQILGNSTYGNMDEEFDHYISVFKKKYNRHTDAAKYAARRKMYVANRAKVAAQLKLFASKKVKWTMRLTEAADKDDATMIIKKANPKGKMKAPKTAVLDAKVKAWVDSVMKDHAAQHPPPPGAAKAANKKSAASPAKPKKKALIEIAGPAGGNNNGGANSGGANNGGANNGGANNGGANNGGANNGGANNGGANNGGANNGGANNGGANNGGANNGGANNGGANNGGANNGGANNGGANNGGANNGGANNGGANNGGANNGGGAYTARPVDNVTIDWSKYDQYDLRTVCPECFGPAEDQGADGTCWVYASKGVFEYINVKNTGKFVRFDPLWIMQSANSAVSLVNTAQQRMMQLWRQQNRNAAGINFLASINSEFTVSDSKSGYASLPFKAASSTAVGGIQVLPPSSLKKDPRFGPQSNAIVIDFSKSYVMGITEISQFQSNMRQYGPAVINIASHDLQLYSNGIFPGDTNPDHGDHFVLAVGYGKYSDGTDYIIFRNSWGANWGVNGYGRIAMNAFDTRYVLWGLPRVAGMPYSASWTNVDATFANLK